LKNNFFGTIWLGGGAKGHLEKIINTKNNGRHLREATKMAATVLQNGGLAFYKKLDILRYSSWVFCFFFLLVEGNIISYNFDSYIFSAILHV
jgi:hypothetical protein